MRTKCWRPLPARLRTRFPALVRGMPTVLTLVVLLAGCDGAGPDDAATRDATTPPDATAASDAAPTPDATGTHDAAPTPDASPDLGPLRAAFQEAGVTGAMLVRRLSDRREWMHDAARVDQRFLPASTFKLVNAAIALETGAVSDPAEVFPWDGVEREFGAWNADHTLATGMAASVVPVYQAVARRIGEPRMSEWLERLGYGNARTAGGIDRFWLDGALAVSAREQVDFLERWVRRDLPLAPSTFERVDAMLVQSSPPGSVLRAKTGWAFEAELGWWVGWVERDGEGWIFALNMDMPDISDAPRRIEVGTEALRRVGALPPD